MPMDPAAPACTTDEQDILDDIDGRMHGHMKELITLPDLLTKTNLWRSRERGKLLAAVPCPPQVHRLPTSYNGFPIMYRERFRALEARGIYLVVSRRLSTKISTSLHVSLDHAHFTGPTGNRNGIMFESLANFTIAKVLTIGVDYCVYVGLHDGSSPASQPTRLFLHGFYMRGSLIGLCIFDRFGLYYSDLLETEKTLSNLSPSFLATSG